MSENTSETENQDRSGKVRGRVQSLLIETYNGLYRSLDELTQLGYTGAEIVEALRNSGEEEIRENYAAWAGIDIREDDATTMDPTVPDPGDAPSYANWSARWIGPNSTLEEDFTGWDILRQLIDEFPRSYVDQTGGGTATLVIQKKGRDVAITAGPGSYNWTTPQSSTFYVNEFYWGPDTYGVDGDEPTHPYLNEPGEALDSENPGTLIQLADRIRAAYAKYNAPKEP